MLSNGNSRLHLDHSSRIEVGTQASQPTPSIQSIRRRILAFTIVGEYLPSASNVLATSETSDRSLGHALNGWKLSDVHTKVVSRGIPFNSQSFIVLATIR